MNPFLDLHIIRKSVPDPVCDVSIVVARLEVDNLDWKDRAQVEKAFRLLVARIEEQLPAFLDKLK